jgi:hypothetical protein
MQSQFKLSHEKTSRYKFLKAFLFIVPLLLVGGAIWSVFGSITHPAGAAPARSAAINPLLYGTNLNLADGDNDQALTAPVAPLLQQMHIKIVRIPMRASTSQATYMKAANLIKSAGAVPLIILETPEHQNSALNDDRQIIVMMNNVFGNGIVYYEFGNEPDLNNSDASWYINSWNKNVPALQRLMSNGRLVGPSTYYANYDYIQSFLSKARPTPSFISWHEYTCDASWDASICISHIDNWTAHIAKIRSIMNATIHVSLPIIISEWNYTPAHSVDGDGKHDNAQFMTAWTTKALNVLAQNNIYASMQFSMTGTEAPLIDSKNHITPQGSVFAKMGK